MAISLLPFYSSALGEGLQVRETRLEVLADHLIRDDRLHDVAWWFSYAPRARYPEKRWLLSAASPYRASFAGTGGGGG
jgi:hypothetical protein